MVSSVFDFKLNIQTLQKREAYAVAYASLAILASWYY